MNFTFAGDEHGPPRVKQQFALGRLDIHSIQPQLYAYYAHYAPVDRYQRLDWQQGGLDRMVTAIQASVRRP